MVTIHVNAVGCRTGACLCAIGVGARNDDDVDVLQQRRQQPPGQFLGNDKQGFAACRLITMLLTDQQDRRALCGIETLRAVASSPCEYGGVDRCAALRGAHCQKRRMRSGGARRRCQLLQPLADFRIGRKSAPIRRQARGIVARHRVPKPCCHCRVFKGGLFLCGAGVCPRAGCRQRDIHR